MAATQAGTAPRRSASTPTTSTASAPTSSGGLRSRRSPRWIAAGVLAVCLGAIGGGTLWTQATHAQPVIRVNQAVARGEVVEATDLGVVNVAVAPGIRTVPASELNALVGRVATVDLAADSLLAPDTVGSVAVEPGTVHLGLQLAAGRLPTKSVPAGAKVTLLAVTAGKGEPVEGRYDAIVVTAPAEAADGTYLLDVAVSQSQAAEIAELASAERLTLVREADR